MRHDNFIAPPRFVKIRSRGRLPHWEVDQAVYFVTFALRDAIPGRVSEELYRQRAQLMRQAKTPDERARLDRALELKLDLHLDRLIGTCLLKDKGAIVAHALRFFDGERYHLHAWCVMPNHVHVLFHLERGTELANVVHSWKSYSAHQIGRGVIWQREYFDRIVRNGRDFEDTKSYVLANPGKAGLRDWPWVG